MPKFAVIAAAVALAVSGCTLGPQYRGEAFDLPESWPTTAEQDGAAPSATTQAEAARWWQSFEDPVLNTLVERAVAENLDLQLQSARMREARAQLGFARAEQWPSLDMQAEATRQRQPGATRGLSLSDGRADPITAYTVSGMLSYEIDLWGRIARGREAAEAVLRQSVFARDALQLSVIADVTLMYFNLRSAELQRQIAERTTQSREESLRLERIRYDAGEADELSLRQVESEVAATRMQIPLLIEQQRLLESALGVLVGLSPAELMESLQLDEGELAAITLPPHAVPTYLPSELLERRPDLRAAEENLKAATAGVGVAEAARLPSLNLVGLIGSVALQGSDLFTGSAEAWSAGGTITGPLFDFGRSRSRVDQAEARREQAVIQYHAAVNNAFREVRDALALMETSAARIETTQDRIRAVSRTVELAELRYEEGYIGLIELLDAQRGQLAAELEHAEAMSEQLAASAALFKALGGGWQDPHADDEEAGHLAAPSSPER